MSEIIVDTLTHSGNSSTANVTLASNGDVSIAGALSAGSFTGAGLFSSYAILEDQKANGTDGGGISSGSWVKRDLNTEVADPDGIVSLSSDQFTLGAGTYLIKWRAPGYHCNIFVAQLYNATDSAVVAPGDPTYCRDLYHYGYSEGAARITITGDKAFEIQQQVNTTANTNGLGLASPFNAGVEVYTRVEIYKEAS